MCAGVSDDPEAAPAEGRFTEKIYFLEIVWLLHHCLTWRCSC